MKRRILLPLGMLAVGAGVAALREARRKSPPSLQGRIFYRLMRPMMRGKPDAIPELRQFMTRQMQRMPVLPGTRFEAVIAGGIPAEWITPATVTGDRVVLYLHGGAYVTGSVADYRGLNSLLAAAAECPVLAVDYRCAPEHPYPAALDDALAAYRWLVANGTAPDQIVIAGDSAGGGLTLATLLALRDAGDALPAGAALLSPWTDLAGTGVSIHTQASADPVLTWAFLDRMAGLYAGAADRRDPLVSPVYAGLRGLPPLLVQVGSAEILLDDSTRLAAQVDAAGGAVTLHVFEGMWHVWHVMGDFMPESRAAFEQIGAFVRQHTAQ